MTTSSLRRLGLAVLVAAVATAAAPADEKQPEHDAVKPAPRKDAGWVKRHESFVDRAKKGDVDVLFLGDSITQGWEGKGSSEVWKKHFEPLKAANFGIGGDRTQHVLWRITEGKELEGIDPKVFVVMIGTNNMSSNSAPEIAEGVTAIVKELNKQRPRAKVLLLGVFPRGARANDKFRDKIKEVNATLAKLDGKQVRYLDFGDKFLDAEGNLPKETMPDALHLSPKGYQIWADAIDPVLKEMLKK
jgi:lysophospholipase L1-like esterase